MIACRYYNCTKRCLRSLRQKIIVKTLSVRGRHRRIKDVAGDEEYIRPTLADLAEQPREKRTEIFRSIHICSLPPQVPV